MKQQEFDQLRKSFEVDGHVKGMTLHDVSLEYLNLKKSVLGELVLENVSFTRCDCRNINCVNANFKAVTFDHCDMSGAQFSGAVFDLVSFLNSNLAGADIADADLKNCRFACADLGKVSFVKSELRNLVMTDVHAKEINLLRAFIEKGDFRNLNFDGGNLFKTAFYDTCLDSVSFAQCNVAGLRLKRTSLKSVRWPEDFDLSKAIIE